MKASKDLIDNLLKELKYKFLGWQNGWRHIYLDESKNPTEDESKKRYFSYSKEEYPEWYKCQMEEKHKCDEVYHSPRGTENTVSCDICKIYWKYDCSG
jgi:hypothetical protein